MTEMVGNAVIESAEIEFFDDYPECLTFYLTLDYDETIGGGQYYGGFKINGLGGDGAGELAGIMRVAGVSQWSQLKGKAIRVKVDRGGGCSCKILALGHIVKDDWITHSQYYPEVVE